jgi:hypothetical protein
MLTTSYKRGFANFALKLSKDAKFVKIVALVLSALMINTTFKKESAFNVIILFHHVSYV